MSKPLRVAVYCRVGNQDPDDFALEIQKQAICIYASRKGYNVEAVIAEQASGITMERDGIRRIMKMARNREIDAMVTTSCSRLGRNMVDLINCTRELHRAGVAVDFMKEGIMSPLLLDIADEVIKHGE